MAFLLISQAQGVSGIMNNLPKDHGVGPPGARGPMQLHRLHRLKAGSADNYLKLGFTSTEVNRDVRSQCVLCLEVVAHGSPTEAELRGHLE